ncbi:MAG: sodium:solute symporter family protein [Sulfolobales archaeon]
MIELVVVLVGYLLLLGFVSLWSRIRTRVGDPVDYFIASRGLTGFISAMTYATTTYSAFMMVGLVGLSYATGVGALVFELSYLISTIAILSIVGVRIWEISRERGYITPTQLLRDMYGSYWATVFVVFMIAIALIPYSSVQIIGPAVILSGISRGAIDYQTAATISAIVIILTTLTAGMRSIAWTDAVQGFIMIFSAVAFLLWLAVRLPPEAISSLGDLGLLSPLNSFWTPYTLIAYTTPWIFFAITNPQVFQKLYIPKDRRAYTRMVLYFSIFGLAYTIISVLVGLIARGLEETGVLDIRIDRDWNKVTPQLLSSTPIILTALVGISILAAATTTINSIVLTISSMISYDTPVPERIKLLIGKIMVVILTLIVYLFALARPGFVVDLAVASSTILLPLLPLYLFSIYGRANKISYIATVFICLPLSLYMVLARVVTAYIPRELVILLLSLIVYLVALLPSRILGRSARR